jgi:plasmid stability protein
MEEEVRQILARAVQNKNKLGDLALQYFGANNGVDLDIPENRPHEPLDFT